jgi:hypothetical protein
MKIQRPLFLITSLLSCVLAFQGCGRLTPQLGFFKSPSQSPSAPTNENGRPYDGKTIYVYFDSQNPCAGLDANGKLSPNEALEITGSDNTITNAALTRTQCQDLNSPQQLNISDVQFNGPSKNELLYAGKTFDVTVNILENPSFESGIGSFWMVNINNGSGVVVQDTATAAPGGGNASAKLVVSQSLGNIWDVSLLAQWFAVTANRQYTVTFWAKADTAGREVRASVAQGYSPWGHYSNQAFVLSTNWQQYTFTYSQPITDNKAEFYIASGQQTGTVWFDLISIVGASP